MSDILSYSSRALGMVNGESDFGSDFKFMSLVYRLIPSQFLLPCFSSDVHLTVTHSFTVFACSFPLLVF